MVPCYLTAVSSHYYNAVSNLPLVFLFAGKELEVMKEKGERAEELEIQMQKLERDNESLQKKVASLGITCEKVCFNGPYFKTSICFQAALFIIVSLCC